MKSFAVIFCCSALLISCTKQKIIDSGTSSPFFAGSMLEYMRTDDYNWKLTVELIEHAGLTELFEGHDASHPSITFFGFTSPSVARFLFDSQYKDSSHGKYYSVRDIPRDRARLLVLRHVVSGKFKKDELAFVNPDYPIDHPQQDGGTNLVTLSGSRIRAFREISAYAGIPGAGPVILRLYSVDQSRLIPVASPDIQPENGVVHSLNYTYEFPVI